MVKEGPSVSERTTTQTKMAHFLALGLLTVLCAVILASSESIDSAKQPPHILSRTLGDFALQQVEVVDATAFAKGDKKLGIDEALLTVNASRLAEDEGDAPFHLYIQYDMCHNCSLGPMVGNISRTKPLSIKVKTQSKCLVHLYNNVNKTPICVLHRQLDEHVKYEWYIMEPDTCNLMYVSSRDAYIPIYIALGVFVILAALCVLVNFAIRSKICHRLRRPKTEALVDSDLGRPTAFMQDNINGIQEEVKLPSKRLKSLDTFRGFSLIIMIFVNYGGGQYWFFHHAAWNGLTVADLVFPWFVFIMGTSIALAFRTLVNRNVPRKYIALKVIKRTAILFFLGLMISNFDKGRGGIDVTTLRIPGVLQRLALTYFLVAMMEVCLAKRVEEQLRYRWWSSMRDILPYWPEWLVVLAAIATHTCLTFLLPLDHGCPTGYIGAGGLQDGGVNYNCTGGAAGYIDRLIFSEKHMYGHPTCKNWYFGKDTESVPYDPEGLLGTLTSALICFLGLQAGRIIIIYDHWKPRVIRFLIWFLTTGLIAGVLCKFSQYDGWIPLNKNLWSLSFVLAMSSFAFFLLAVFYLLIDVFSIWSGTPFYYPGMNSIVIYMCHEIFEHYFPVRFKVPETHAAQLILDIYGAAIWVVLAMVLHHKDIFIAI